jgi:transcriptional regulator of acetoin/glycerol metabolism
MPPGLLVLWCGRAPCWHTLQLTDRELVIGRDLLDSLGLVDRDRRISGQHARVARTANGIEIEDLGSRNGTFVGRSRVARSMIVVPPAVIRLGQTIAMAVGDVAYYAKTPVHLVNDLVVGPSSQPLHHHVEQLAKRNGHLALIGPNGSGRTELARVYARARQQPFIVFDALGKTSLAEAVEADTRTVIFPVIDRLKLTDRDALAALLDRPGMRVVSTAQTPLDEPHRKNPPLELARRLQGELVKVPVVADRIEEVPLLIARTVERVSPKLVVHPTAIEYALTYRWPGNWLELVHGVTKCAREVLERRKTEIRASDLENVLTRDHVRMDRRPLTDS